jgi:Putative abortive phage resistance protein AbiGi, antitoxin
MSDRYPPERFFYHSFPRRGRGSDGEIEKGCKILSLITKIGLVMAPEALTWSYPHADGSPPREQQTLQRRVCFTELAPHELREHARLFGSFALEFKIDTLRSMGAMPVFYVPQITASDNTDLTALGSVLVIQTIDAMILTMRLAGIKKNLDDATDVGQGRFDATFGFQQPTTFSLDVVETRNTLEAFTFALTPPDMLEQALTGLLSCFYPADNVRNNETLAYYRQREWRIAWNLAIKCEETLRRPSNEIIDQLLGIDAEFFGRDFPTAAGTRRLAEEALIFPSIGGKRIIDMVNRVVVPSAALTSANALLAKAAPNVPVVCFDDIT